MPIKVWVVPYGRTNLQLQWIDPITGKRKTKTSGTKNREAAIRKAATLEKELNTREPKDDGSLPWKDFVELYKSQHLSSLADASADRATGVLSIFTEQVGPKNLRVITSQVVRQHAAWLRKNNRSEATIALHMRTLKAALKWAVDSGHAPFTPTFPKIQRSGEGDRPAKGRPLTMKEFLAMLRAVKQVVGPDAAKSWRRFLWGLWRSGLRLGEALELGWTARSPLWISVDDGELPLLAIRASGEKGNKTRLLPLVQDFSEWIFRVPENQRTGLVFKLDKQRHKDVVTLEYVSKVIAKIGEASGVVVAETGKFASAHDLRRSFGLRWAHKSYPAELQQLMRHSDINTTMTYYARIKAQELAAKLWRHRHNTQHNRNE